MGSFVAQDQAIRGTAINSENRYPWGSDRQSAPRSRVRHANEANIPRWSMKRLRAALESEGDSDEQCAADRSRSEPVSDRGRPEPPAAHDARVLPARGQPGQRSDPRQDGGRRPCQHRRGGSRHGQHPRARRTRRDLPRVRARARPSNAALLPRQPAGTRAGCDRLSGLLLPLLAHEDRPPCLAVRAVHDRLGFLVCGDVDLCCLLRRRHRGRGRGPSDCG